ncbi:hypothetical protein [Cupriavidus sp. UBA2534]|uniref:hypothetical protein n=1 Tax=Cupriavidus sp. UBA2534 TaxID=1946399 RepID=UPI000E81A796|nr:hypothetical protein [Cupriavidus sp. UBA2534]HBO82072.1 hypothetical protein [Cupriavidus sp.]
MTCTQQRFERDVAEHQMTVIRDDGNNRHLKFKAPGSSAYWFEILTWPGALCIRGDCGTYVFSRLSDMFEFFRTDDRGDPNKLYVNPQYWIEKLLASDANGRHPNRIEELDESAFRKMVHEQIDSYLGIDTGECTYPAELVREIKSDLRQEVWTEVTSTTSPYDAHRLIYDFCFTDAKGQRHYPFADTESVPTRYTFHVMWNLYAIAWVIRKYDAHRTALASTEAAAA